MPTRVAVDIGGTFTDLVHLEAESGAVGAAKASTTPRRFEDGVMEALGQADLDGVDFLAHGTTVIINALKTSAPAMPHPRTGRWYSAGMWSSENTITKTKMLSTDSENSRR